MNHNLLLALATNRLPGHNGWQKRIILDASRDENDWIEGVKKYSLSCHRARSINAQKLLRVAEYEIKVLDSLKIRCHVLGDPHYPFNLAQIADPPLILYYRGVFPMHTKPPVAVVGTRRPDSNGKKEAFKLALEFSLSGYPVVSGLALGIDRSAHEGALAAGSRCTWAVLAGGLDKPSPLSHRFLASKILDAGGALLGEVPPGQFPAKYAFPRRNRILSGLCRACVVVEAPQRSGALITANFALDQDRDVYVASSGVLNARFIGTCALEEQGAPVVRGAADILKDWGSLGYFPTIQEVENPSDSGDLIRMMQSELDDRLFRHTGGWFEFCSS